MIDEEGPDKSNSVLLVEGINLPIGVGKWILEESCDVLEGSPSLSVISGFSCGKDSFSEVAISFLCKSSNIFNC